MRSTGVGRLLRMKIVSTRALRSTPPAGATGIRPNSSLPVYMLPAASCEFRTPAASNQNSPLLALNRLSDVSGSLMRADITAARHWSEWRDGVA